MKKFGKSTKNRVVFGVCGGIGEYLNLDPTIIRIAFIALNFFVPYWIFIYIMVGVVLPVAPEEDVTISPEPQKPYMSFESDGFDIKNAQDAKIITDKDCGCNNASFDNTASGSAHGSSNSQHDEEAFFKESRKNNDKDFN